MSTYIMSDIHGASERFHALLAEIPIDLTVDVLYINGDIVDRGKDSLRLFFEILEMQKEYGGHLVITKGNHELFLEQYLDRKLAERTYSSYGGEDTIRELALLDTDTKRALRDVLRELPIYQVINTEAYGPLVIVHTGFNLDYLVQNPDGTVDVIRSLEKSMSCGMNYFLINGDLQYDAPSWVLKGLDKCICIGHVPTPHIDTIQAPLIGMLPGGKVIVTDCGAGIEGGRLGCLRIEDGATFYR